MPLETILEDVELQLGERDDFTTIPIEVLLEYGIGIQSQPDGGSNAVPEGCNWSMHSLRENMKIFCVIFMAVFGVLFSSAVIIILALRVNYKWILGLPLIIICALLCYYGGFEIEGNRARPLEQAREKEEETAA